MNYRRPVNVPRLDVKDPTSLASWSQFMQDTLLHIDECLDMTRDEFAKELKQVRDAIADLNATFQSFTTAIKTEQQGIQSRLASHKTEHEILEAQDKARKGVWRNSYTVANEVLRIAVVLAGFGLLKWLGL